MGKNIELMGQDRFRLWGQSDYSRFMGNLFIFMYGSSVIFIHLSLPSLPPKSCSTGGLEPLCQVASVVCDSLWLYELWPARLLCPWGFSRQDYRNGLPFPPPGDPPEPGIEPTSLMSPALAGGFFTTGATWEAPPCLFATLRGLELSVPQKPVRSLRHLDYLPPMSVSLSFFLPLPWWFSDAIP